MLYIHVFKRKQLADKGVYHSKTLHGSLSHPFVYIWVYYYVWFLKLKVLVSLNDINKKEILGKRMKPTSPGNRVQTSTSMFIAMKAWSVYMTTQALSSIIWNFFRPVSRRMRFWSQSTSVQRNLSCILTLHDPPALNYQRSYADLTWNMQNTWVISKYTHHLKLHCRICLVSFLFLILSHYLDRAMQTPVCHFNPCLVLSHEVRTLQLGAQHAWPLLHVSILICTTISS